MGKFLLIVLVLGVALGIGGYTNYERNAHLDEELRDRPYAGYSDADLDSLTNAYEGEMSGLQARLGKAAGDNTRVMDGYAPADFDGKVKAFEQFQRKNNAYRDTNRKRLGHQVELENLQKEQRIRSEGLNDEFTRIKRRVLTF